MGRAKILKIKKPKKKKARGKKKGNGFETTIRRQITKAFSAHGITDTDAFKSILSGAHKESFGDISLSKALSKLYPYATECKWHRKIDLYNFLTQWEKMVKSNQLKNWWAQAIEGAAKCKHLYPLLVFKSNNKSTFCIIQSNALYSVLGVQYNILRKKNINHITVYHPDGSELYGFEFKYLLKMLVNKAKKGPNK